jgi:hypothetical protein
MKDVFSRFEKPRIMKDTSDVTQLDLDLAGEN